MTDVSRMLRPDAMTENLVTGRTAEVRGGSVPDRLTLSGSAVLFLVTAAVPFDSIIAIFDVVCFRTCLDNFL